MNLVLGGWLALTLSAGGLKVAAAPGVVVLSTNASPEVTAREKKLYEQLSLALDAFSVMLTPPAQEDFSRLTLPEQVGLALPEAEAAGAVAVVWLVRPAPRQVMVHLVARNTGRTLVKTVETTSGPDAEATLALVVRELLGAAFLFEPPASLPPGLGSVVQGVRQQVAPPPPPAQPVALQERPLAPGAAFRVSLLGAARFGAQVGDATRGGVQASRTAWVAERLTLCVTAELSGGPFVASSFSLAATELTAGLELFVPVTNTRSFGPFASLAVGGRLAHGAVGARQVDDLNFTGTLHVGVRGVVRLSETVHLAFDVAVGVRPVPNRLMDGPEVLWREGWAEVRSSAGVVWEVR